LARDVAGSLMFALGQNADIRLHDLFDPIGQKLVEDYAAIRQGRYSAQDGESRRLLLAPVLFSLPQVDSMMAVDQTGGGLLVLRYTESVRRGAFLQSVADTLPNPDPDRLQYVTRDFRPLDWGETTRFALWDDAGRKLVNQWVLPLPGYDTRQRPWYKTAMAVLRDRTLSEAQAAGSSLVGWTEPYTLFISKAPGISGVVAARDPSGNVQIVTYNLPLGDIARFTMSVQPSRRGMMFVMTDDEKLIGPPRVGESEGKNFAALSSLQPVAKAGFPSVAAAVAKWHEDHLGRSERFRLTLNGETWWAGFTPFEIGSQHRLWIGMLLPESDLIPGARQHEWLIAAVGMLAVLAAALLALRIARWFSEPLAELASQSRRIASLDLTESAPVRSHLTELDLLSVTLGRMRDALRKHIDDLRDAAKRQRVLEGQLREAQKLEAVGLLAGGIAHDFNNLLQVIGGNASLALDSGHEDRNREGALDAIIHAVRQASQLTRQLLAVGRRQALHREQLELNSLVATHLSMVRRLLPENIHIDTRAAPEPVVMVADKGQLEQVLLNLSLNARDAMPAGGQLSIALETLDLDAATAKQLCQQPAGHFVRVTVSDTGHGMTSEALERIFEPFFSTKPHDKGSGLGLAVVYGIIRQHGGHISARSEPGRGTQFMVLLPCEASGQTPNAETASAQPASERRGPVAARILLAEDNEAVRRVAQRVLAHLGAHVVAAVDGQQAVDLFAANPGQFDLLFLDVMMPGLSGFEVATRCRSLRPEIPVLFASGYAAESLVTPGEGTISDTILRKPYDPETLRAAVRMLAPKPVENLQDKG
jgi:signal transduction histidine kinase/ActR/RegA family two-component response regulator